MHVLVFNKKCCGRHKRLVESYHDTAQPNQHQGAHGAVSPWQVHRLS